LHGAQDQWSTNEELFRKACASFKVLDAPEYQDMKEQEKRDLINKEGRDPTKAILDAHKTGDDKDKKEPPKDAPKDAPKDPKKTEPPK